jgi:hypothetical protein
MRPALPASLMQTVNAAALAAMRDAAREHDATAQMLRDSGLSLSVADPLRRGFLQCASRAFTMARLVRSLADTLERTGEALELHDAPAPEIPETGHGDGT